MKTRIALFALAAGALVVIGCAGVPAAVDRFGNMQPDIQAPGLSADAGGVETEIRPFFMPGYWPSSFGPFGFNYFQSWQPPMTFAFPYNQDSSITLFKSDGLQIKLMPAVKYGNF